MRRFSVYNLKIGQNQRGRSAKGPAKPENLVFPDFPLSRHPRRHTKLPRNPAQHRPIRNGMRTNRRCKPFTGMIVRRTGCRRISRSIRVDGRSDAQVVHADRGRSGLRQRREQIGQLTLDSSSSGRRSSGKPAGAPERSSRSGRAGGCGGIRDRPDSSPDRKPRPAAAPFPRGRPPLLRSQPGGSAPGSTLRQ